MAGVNIRATLKLST